MRVTDLTIQRNFLYNIFGVEKRLGELQDMASSGKSITRPQDDPVGSEKSISLRHDLCVNDQYLRNIDKAKTWMSQTEQAMAHATSVLSRVHDLALYGGTGTTPDEARNAIAAEVSQLKEELSSVFNTTVDGRNLLYGTMPVWRLGTDVTLTCKGIEAIMTDVNAYMDQLEQGLQTSNVDDIAAAAEGLDQALDKVLSHRAENGAKLRRLDTLEEKSNDMYVEYKRVLSNVEEVDLTEVVVKLMSQQMAYQSALAVGARLIQPSLLDYLQ
ncbi:MAG: hypothetical protein KBI40_03890 [Firmicutes bacterium]|jgi:flagellar hook-associated protein 3 FlgL|nr:hypothetical protein [Candidatus Fermentithermobacillaceae bacterium]